MFSSLYSLSNVLTHDASGAPASMRAVRAHLARSLSTSFLRRVLHSLDDMLIARAATQISFQPMPNLVARRIWIAIDDLGRSYNHPRRAVATLQSVMFPEALLHRMQLPIRGQSFDSCDVRAVGLHGAHRAGLHGLAVKQHGARAADRSLATDMRARQSQQVAQVMH